MEKYEKPAIEIVKLEDSNTVIQTGTGNAGGPGLPGHSLPGNQGASC